MRIMGGVSASSVCVLTRGPGFPSDEGVSVPGAVKLPPPPLLSRMQLTLHAFYSWS